MDVPNSRSIGYYIYTLCEPTNNHNIQCGAVLTPSIGSLTNFHKRHATDRQLGRGI